MIKIFLFSFLFALSSHAVPPQAAPVRPLPSIERLREFPLTTIKKHRDILIDQDWATEKNPINIDSRAISWGFNLIYQGEVKPVSPERQKLVSFVETTSPQLKGQYKNEILVSDGETLFWLPIQNGTLEYFKKDQIRKGEKFFAQTRYFGTYYKETSQQFFLMLGYRKTVSFF